MEKLTEFAFVAILLFVLGGLILVVSLPGLLARPKHLWATATARVGVLVASFALAFYLCQAALVGLATVITTTAWLSWLCPLMYCLLFTGVPVAFIVAYTFWPWATGHQGFWAPMWRWLMRHFVDEPIY